MPHLLTTPQIKYPFRVVNGQVDCFEQDSPEDLIQNAITIMRYRQGDRPALPEFGIPDPPFVEGGITALTISAEVQRWEPGVTVDEVNRIINGAGEHNLSLNVTATRE